MTTGLLADIEFRDIGAVAKLPPNENGVPPEQQKKVPDYPTVKFSNHSTAVCLLDTSQRFLEGFNCALAIGPAVLRYRLFMHIEPKKLFNQCIVIAGSGLANNVAHAPILPGRI